MKKKERKHHSKTLQRAEEFFKKLKKDLKTLKRYWYNIIENIDYKGIKEIENWFNKINEEDHYEPIKTKHAFDDNYIVYESRGDKDNN